MEEAALRIANRHSPFIPPSGLIVCLAAGAALAEPGEPRDLEQADESIVVEGTPPSAAEREAQRALEDPALVARVRLDERLPPSATLADVIGHTVGAEVRSVGGLGGFASVSIRGLGAGHTPVLVDGVPISRIAMAAADLSRFDLHSFGEVELFRCAVPADLGARGIGGALSLISAVGPGADGERASASAGLGSFGARHLRARVLGGDAQDFGYQLGIGYAGATGDYKFFDDNGTNLNTSDDTISRRTNNGFDRLDTIIRARERRRGRETRGGARLMLKRQGLPGIGSRQTDSASLESATGIIDASAAGIELAPAIIGRVIGFVMFDIARVADNSNEIGIGVGDSESNVVTGGLGAAVTRRGRHLEHARVALDARLDHFTHHARVAGVPEDVDQIGGRATTALSFDAAVPIGAHARLLPSARVEFVSTDAVGGAARNDLDIGPTLAALVRATPSLSIKASTSYAVRQPTIVELFGDRGVLAGNPEILPERGPAADLGLVWAPTPEGLAGLGGLLGGAIVEVAAFWSRPKDAIVYFPVAGGVSRPLNIDAARNIGAELSAEVAISGGSAVTANYTLLDARQRSQTESLDGKRLPHRARHQLYGRLDHQRVLIGRRVRVWADASFASGNVVDQANILELPARHFFGAGVTVELERRLAISVEGKNLSDNTVELIELSPPPRPDLTEVPRPVSDFFGYPLPGRAFYATIRARF